MFLRIVFSLLCLAGLVACNVQSTDSARSVETLLLQGTWKLISGTLIEGGDTTVTDYTRNEEMIKIINDSHFAFLRHDVNKGQDSRAIFVAAGGRYALEGNRYTEHVEFCSAREWEGHSFEFTVDIEGDTLVQQGIERVEAIGVDRYNIEKYARIKPAR
ncbi:MAG: hypothetical protein DIU61_003245 [Bacteroidota bacterium]|jgi:hypothetical protein|nr:MAG: hypothetical protein DIU61_04825 [Bacteroidota bacterium]